MPRSFALQPIYQFDPQFQVTGSPFIPQPKAPAMPDSPEFVLWVNDAWL
jgi:hypothetical protein